MRKILLVVWICLGVLPLAAQDMRTVFVAMPDSVLPLLTKVNREDCIDFLDSKMRAVVKNRFGGEAEMEVLTEDYTRVKTSAAGTMELKLLPLNDSVKVVCMVRTACAAAADSDVRFYAADWSRELDAAQFLPMPSVDAFFVANDTVTDEAVRVRQGLDVHAVKATLSAEDASLTFIYTAPDRLNKEDKALLMPLLRKEPIVLRWRDGRFGDATL